MKLKMITAIAAFAALGATAAQAGKGMADADADGDGFVSLAEFKAAHNERIERHFARVDANADGLLSDDEMAAAHDARRGEHGPMRHRMHRGEMDPERALERLDADGSGGVSFDEFDGRRFGPDAATFQAADGDGNGELDASELEAMMKARRAERRATDRDREG